MAFGGRFWVTGTFGILLLTLGAIFLLTSLIGFCPLYAPFGISTCAVRKARSARLFPPGSRVRTSHTGEGLPSKAVTSH